MGFRCRRAEHLEPTTLPCISCGRRAGSVHRPPPGFRERSDKIEGVTLIGATRTPGRPESEALSRRPALPKGFTPDVIIGHGRVTGPAAQALAEDHFLSAKLLHFVHMAPDEDRMAKARSRRRCRNSGGGAHAGRTQSGSQGTRVVAVGLTSSQSRLPRDLSAYEVPAPCGLTPVSMRSLRKSERHHQVSHGRCCWSGARKMITSRASI